MPADPAPSPGAGRLRALFEAAGAQWLELPVLHPADIFLETAGEDIRRRMFVTEGRRGESLALRPDFTIPVCLHHLTAGAGPARYAYEGLVFRRHVSGAPERLETGYEDLGRRDRAGADAETVALALEGAARLDGGQANVRIGDIGLFVALLSALGLPEAWRRRLRRSFGVPGLMEENLRRLAAPREANGGLGDPAVRTAAEAGPAALAALLDSRLEAHGHAPGAGRTAAEIAGRFLDQLALSQTRLAPEAVKALGAYLAIEAPLAAASERLDRFARRTGLDLDQPIAAFAARAAALAGADRSEIMFSAAFGRPLDYYTGLVFELRCPGAELGIGGGGRYDRLMEMLGAPAPVPAVGFSLRLDGGEGVR